MTELFETEDVHDRRMVRGLSGLLGAFNEAGLLEAADVHVAQRLCSIVGETDETVALAVGVAVRAVRHGSVCVDLTALVESLPALPWPPLARMQKYGGFSIYDLATRPSVTAVVPIEAGIAPPYAAPMQVAIEPRIRP